MFQFTRDELDNWRSQIVIQARDARRIKRSITMV